MSISSEIVSPYIYFQENKNKLQYSYILELIESIFLLLAICDKIHPHINYLFSRYIFLVNPTSTNKGNKGISTSTKLLFSWYMGYDLE